MPEMWNYKPAHLNEGASAIPYADVGSIVLEFVTNPRSALYPRHQTIYGDDDVKPCIAN